MGWTNLPTAIYTLFGKPGSGKTTIAAQIASECFRKGYPCYSNVPIIGAYKINKKQIGLYNLPVSSTAKRKIAVLILDEMSIEWDNRNFKTNISQQLNQWLLLHRHYKCLIFCLSQTWANFDLKFRNLTQKYYLVNKSLLFPRIIRARRIQFDVGINEMTDQIEDKYEFDSFFVRLFTTKHAYGPLYWKLFDSYDAPTLPDLPLVKYESSKAEVPDQGESEVNVS